MQRIRASSASLEIPGGLIHDWGGIIFISGAKLKAVLAILQDYNQQATYFAPDVEQARIEDNNGDNYRVFLRLRRVKVVTVVLDAEHNVTYFHDSTTRAHSQSSAIRIAEIENQGTISEKEDQPGQGVASQQGVHQLFDLRVPEESARFVQSIPRSARSQTALD